MALNNGDKVVIGIHYGHNCTVGISIDGQILAMLSEERLCRIKNSTGFPIKSLHEIVNTYLNGDFSIIDVVTLSDGDGTDAKYLLARGLDPAPYIDYYWKSKKGLLNLIHNPATRLKSSFITSLKNSYSYLFFKDYRNLLFKKSPLLNNTFQYHDHHLSHAASLACFEPINDGEKWLIFTLDGEGGGLSSTVSTFEDGQILRLSSNSNKVSLGWLYSETTAYLGMKSNEHEFKLMGMAPYADKIQVDRLTLELKKILWLNSNGDFVSKISTNKSLPILSKIYAFERFDVIAGAIQKFTEELIIDWIGFWVEKINIRKIGLSGGVFMNVKAVKNIAEMSNIMDLFVMPSASDESLPFGSIWLANKQLGLKTNYVSDLYLGREFGKSNINDIIEEQNLSEKFKITEFDSYKDANKKVAELLYQDEIVARCVGREEWGARALGNRSILCNSSKFQNIERLNSQVKNRDFWMPFTPSILLDEFPKYVINPKNIFAPYMSITFDSTKLAREHFSGAVHPRDFTMRPQAVIKEWNSSYYDLIKQYSTLSGIGGLLNTSFNLHGEPNVSTPSDAVRTVIDSGLNYLLLGDFLFEKLANNKAVLN